ncbi:hypothetical protein LZ32DRAFT_457309 [Colletotrichum eremochloae]|nr:hypothetical protein LZ32DRAFT_457309 [Colletotrichum eremochloae]
MGFDVISKSHSATAAPVRYYFSVCIGELHGRPRWARPYAGLYVSCERESRREGGGGGHRWPEAPSKKAGSSALATSNASETTRERERERESTSTRYGQGDRWTGQRSLCLPGLGAWSENRRMRRSPPHACVGWDACDSILLRVFLALLVVVLLRLQLPTVFFVHSRGASNMGRE